MARITVEDCITRIPNHFNLTLPPPPAPRRRPTGPTPRGDATRNNNPTVTALREIAAGQIGEEILSRSK